MSHNAIECQNQTTHVHLPREPKSLLSDYFIAKPAHLMTVLRVRHEVGG